jgi:hypothetical protein
VARPVAARTNVVASADPRSSTDPISQATAEAARLVGRTADGRIPRRPRGNLAEDEPKPVGEMPRRARAQPGRAGKMRDVQHLLRSQPEPIDRDLPQRLLKQRTACPRPGQPGATDGKAARRQGKRARHRLSCSS